MLTDPAKMYCYKKEWKKKEKHAAMGELSKNRITNKKLKSTMQNTMQYTNNDHELECTYDQLR